jgi:hypothetical protein
MKTTKTHSIVAGATLLALLPWSGAFSQDGGGSTTQTVTTRTTTVFTDVPVSDTARQYQVRVLGVLQSRSAGNTVTTFERVVTDDVQLANAQQALLDARNSLESAAGKQAVVIGPAELQSSSVGSTVTTGQATEIGRTFTEDVVVTSVIGAGPSGTIITIGNLDVGGVPFLVRPGTQNIDELYITNFSVTREIRTTTNTTKAAEYRVVGLVD